MIVYYTYSHDGNHDDRRLAMSNLLSVDADTYFCLVRNTYPSYNITPLPKSCDARLMWRPIQYGFKGGIRISELKWKLK